MDLKYTLIENRHLRAIDAIKSVTEDFYLTGSIALTLLGIIRRPISDVDIVIRDKNLFKKFEELFGGKYLKSYDVEVETTAECLEPTHLRFDLAGVSVCVFLAQIGEKTIDIITDDGQTFMVSEPKTIFEVKSRYMDTIISKPITEKSLSRLKKNLNDTSAYLFYLNQKNS